VADFSGKKLVGFRTGPTNDPERLPNWPSRGTWPIYDTTGDGYEIGGVLPVNGNPFTYTCDNVN
jgi:hypothetical protein